MLPDELKKEIEKRGLNQAEFSDLIGVSRPTVTMWIDGKRNMSKQSKMLLKLSNKQLKKIQVK